MPPATFHITASAIKSHFKHRCERHFRWEAVPTPLRGKPGIGWDVPKVVRIQTRPGIGLLLQAGNRFELEQLAALEAELALAAPVQGVEPRLYHAGLDGEEVLPTPVADALRLFAQPQAPRFIAQVEINPAAFPSATARLLRQFGLDPTMVELGSAKPDLLELLPADAEHPLRRVRIWDVKASQVAQHEHFIQVAYYALLLELAREELGISDLVIDHEEAVIAARQERTSFALRPYILGVSDFLHHQMPALLALPAAEAHFHVCATCGLCEYVEECRARANAARDLSRIPFLSSESKRHMLKMGVRGHADLLHLDPDQIQHLRDQSHDLMRNMVRYLALAHALQDGQERLLDTQTFQMPRYEDVRVVLSAEQDAVTGTCFALGIKVVAWDRATNKPQNQEYVFVAEQRDDEISTMLLPFLQTLNRFLEQVDAENAAIRATPIEQSPQVVAAQQQVEAMQAQFDTFKLTHAEAMRKHNPEAKALREERKRIEGVLKLAQKEYKQVEKEVRFELRRQQRRLHFYFYDTLDLLALKALIERHLFSTSNPVLQLELSNLVRLFPPASLLPDAETFRTIPATVVVSMLRRMVALPVPYDYDLRTVAERYQPDQGGYRFSTPYGFSWEYSNQIAFERIHDVWNGQSFTYKARDGERTLEPATILETLKKAVLNKLRATDSVIRRLKQDMGERLRLNKEPFQLLGSHSLSAPTLEQLRIFTTLEVSLDELEVKQSHTQPIADRVASFVCIHGLCAESEELNEEGTLWFRFDPSASDAKFEVGDFNLVLTPEDEPGILLSEIDGDLFNGSARWRFAPYKVSLVAYDLQSLPPRLCIKPDNLNAFVKQFDPQRRYMLDRLFMDYNSGKVFEVLDRLGQGDEYTAHIAALLASGQIPDWQPFVDDVIGVETELRQRIRASGYDPERLLNPGQWRAWRGVLHAPLSLVWGPPGTGKTHTIAHMLIGYALAARHTPHPLRLLVTAFTHHAINHVLRKVEELAHLYGLGEAELAICKLQRDAAHEESLPETIQALDPKHLAGYLENPVACQIIGSTVWGVHRAMDAAGDVAQHWFDLILVDEASQLKLPDALIALAASRPQGSIILAGDDRQLPPIIRGAYPETHAHLLTSVFAFVRQHIDSGQHPGLEERILFQLEDNFRMNDLLTAYPRERLYNGRFFATKPDIRMMSALPLDHASHDMIEFLLYPDRPVMLVRYKPPRSYTARNPLEAELAAQILNRLRGLLIDQRSGKRYSPSDFASEGVAVLAPHRAQNSSIRQMLREYGFDQSGQPMPLVDTVDKLQGQERDVVIMSYGVADQEYAETEAEFLLSSNRFNVAATRARHKLIVFCADTVLDLIPRDQQVLLDAMMLKEFRNYCDSGQREMHWTTQTGEEVPFVVQWKAFGDT